MSEPEILSIEEVREIAAEFDGFETWSHEIAISRLCATVESWQRTAALRHEAMTAAAEERDRLRALVGRMRLYVTEMIQPRSRQRMSAGVIRRGWDELLADPDGQGAAEQFENLQWAERRLANITQTCRSEFGQSRTGEPAEAILDRVVEELRLLREWETASVAIVDCVGDPREAYRTQRKAWAALRAFREGQAAKRETDFAGAAED